MHCTEPGLYALGLTHLETMDLLQAKRDLVKARTLFTLYYSHQSHLQPIPTRKRQCLMLGQGYGG